MRRPNKLLTFIGGGRNPHRTLERLLEEGLLLKNADMEKVFSLIVTVFIEELDCTIKFAEEEKRLLVAQKERGFMCRAQEQFCVPPGEYRAHMMLDGPLKPFLSPKGLDFMHTLESRITVAKKPAPR